MSVDELLNDCFLTKTSSKLLLDCSDFSCGDSSEEQDLNEFLLKDSLVYDKKLLGKTYAFCKKSNPRQLVTFFTLSNDSIRLSNKLADKYRNEFLELSGLMDKRMRRFPSVLLGRLGTNKQFASCGYGSSVMDFIKSMFRLNNKTGCRFIIVDALNNDKTINFYKKNGFRYLVNDERLEAKYVGIGVGQLPLKTRLMYFDLLLLKVADDVEVG